MINERISIYGDLRDTKIDFVKRRIFLVGEIDADAFERVIFALHAFESDPAPIYVTLNSCGGSESHGYAIYDALRAARSEIVIDGYGEVASIAAAIFQAGDIRRLSPNCEYMIHNGSRYVGDSEEQPNNEILRLARSVCFDGRRYRHILMDGASRRHRREPFTERQLKAWCDKERSFTTYDAIKFGFADFVIGVGECPAAFDVGACLRSLNDRKAS